MLQHSDLKTLFIGTLGCFLFELIKFLFFLEEKITLEISGKSLSVIIVFLICMIYIYVSNTYYNEKG